MLATLYAKALDADAPRSILRDHYAKAAVARIDYDWKTTTINTRRAPSVAVRTAHFDNWTRQFLAVHHEAVVLHVGCGLDARVYRVDPGPGVRWYDIDYPEVIGLRERVYPGRTNYRMLPASVTDPAWLADIPTDRPALLLGEGLTMYLTKADGLALLGRVVDRSASGELQFDAFNTFGIRTQWINAVVRRSGSKLHWGSTAPPTSSTLFPGCDCWRGNRCSTAIRSRWCHRQYAGWAGRWRRCRPYGRWRNITATHSGWLCRREAGKC
jgi:O-methyltransferase involved in polyketide biosynthesis